MSSNAARKDITDFLYKEGKSTLGEINECRLTVREEDIDFFRDNVQKPGGIARLVADTTKLLDRLPEPLRQTLTCDQGREMTCHRELTKAVGMTVCFCNPHSVFLQSAQSLAEGQLREHEWAAAPVSAQGRGLEPVQPAGT